MTTLRASALLALLMACAGVAQAQPTLPSTVTLSPILDASEKRDTISQINDDLSRSSPVAKLLGCQTLIDYVEQMPSGHDSSFGAVCKVRSQGSVKRVTVCDERMVGKFYESDEVVATPGQIGLFVQAHCPPGG